ncbi:amidohydrolase family protein [Pararhodobacter zhoushanensis]|uniref:amidohydrolase family protein n=1 Tax=Pararhodobacter zhoushanensis TaxID=2479545 RepID=UPI000F8D2F39|nr:amidohydrolase family protein [Pararhodobacter zhoushanensis]
MSGFDNPLPTGQLTRPDVPCVIDMHGHCGAPEAEALLASRPERAAEMGAQARSTGAASSQHNRTVMLPAAGARMASLEKRLADLDLMGVDVQLVAPSPHLYAYWADEGLAGELVAVVNAAAVALVARAPERLAGMGMVSMQYPDLAAQQIHAAKAAGLKGIEISASVGERELSDPVFTPVWAAAEETGLPVFIHPLGTSLGARLDRFYLSNTIGQPVETTIALTGLILSGVLDRHPRLKLVGAHGGGYLPAYIGRADHTWCVRPEARGCAALPSEYLSRIWVDTVVFDRTQLSDLVQRMGADRVMFGTDYPFDMADCRPDQVAAALPLSARAAVMGGTAAALFNL